MKLEIHITDIDHNLEDNEIDGLHDAWTETRKIILEYCKLGIKPNVGEMVCTEDDYVLIITSICYCDWKIMYNLKLIEWPPKK